MLEYSYSVPGFRNGKQGRKVAVCAFKITIRELKKWPPQDNQKKFYFIIFIFFGRKKSPKNLISSRVSFKTHSRVTPPPPGHRKNPWVVVSTLFLDVRTLTSGKNFVLVSLKVYQVEISIFQRCSERQTCLGLGENVCCGWVCVWFVRWHKTEHSWWALYCSFPFWNVSFGFGEFQHSISLESRKQSRLFIIHLSGSCTSLSNRRLFFFFFFCKIL